MTMNGSNYPRAMVDLLSGRRVFMVDRVGSERRNFVLGFREKLTDTWVS